jgi:SAM-dependent methyltransferase
MSPSETPHREVAGRLRCPRCSAALREHGPALECLGSGCGTRYPIVQGAPVLIDERVSVFRIADYTDGRLGKPPLSSLHAWALRFLPSLDRNVSARRNAALLRERLFARTAAPVILNIGGKHPRAALAALRRDPAIECVECDCIPGASVAVIADPRRLPFADASFDAVFVDGVLEHSVAPREIADEIHRVLRPAGLVYADTPFMLPVHGGAYDFERFSGLAHRRLFAGFRELESGVSSGPAAALGYAIQSLLLSYVRGRRSRFAVKTLCRVTLFWVKYLDAAVVFRPAARDAALGLYFIGERAETALDDRTLVGSYVGNTPDLYSRAP